MIEKNSVGQSRHAAQGGSLRGLGYMNSWTVSGAVVENAALRLAKHHPGITLCVEAGCADP